MPDLVTIKQDLNLTIDASRPDGTYDDETFDRIHDLIKQLVPHTPTPSPLDKQEFVQSAWGSRFAQFGPKHTAGKPISHDTSLKLQSFARFPNLPIKIHAIAQEIRVADNHYNNVTDISTPDGKHHATLIVWGRYRIEPDAPQRYIVDFYAAEIRPPANVSEEALRAQFGLEPDAPLRRDIKPPKLYSDVVYCDEDMRINFGSMGGVYVMNRLASDGKSVSFT